MQTDFDAEIKQGHKLLENKLYSSSIIINGKILERLLKQLYRQCCDGLGASEKMRVLEIEEKIGKKKPINEFTLGQLIGLFTKAGLFKAVNKQRNLKAKFFKPEMLNKINKLRNLCVHTSYETTKEEAQWVEVTTLNILRELGISRKLPKIKPKSFESLKFKSQEERIIGQVRQVLMLMAEKPEYEYQDDIEFELGLIYSIYAKVKLVGAYERENEITILVQLTDTIIHDNVVESVHEDICDQI